VTPASPPRIGLSTTAWFLRSGEVDPLGLVRRAADAGVDYLQVGDHVSFHDGTGFDGFVLATAALAAQPTLPVHVGLYLLALRHPVPVARQLAEMARLAPGRLVFGVGVGGEDRHEFEICGVDPASRGRRTDESLALLRRLLAGAPVDHEGAFYRLQAALVAPAPRPAVPVMVGGRSDAALRRAGRLGDGWLGLWLSDRRYAAAVSSVEAAAAECGRDPAAFEHGLNLWCALPGADGQGGTRLAEAMESRYKMPFDRFSRWCPVGDAETIAEFINGYASVGCRSVTLVLHTPDPAEAIEQAASVRACLHGQ
jgi:alkanesulfonate monooxygenase SsuD/methylene tetrahydromethanopterin reductase-like flavin-dependent oxidoreductase (luciferase family)